MKSSMKRRNRRFVPSSLGFGFGSECFKLEPRLYPTGAVTPPPAEPPAPDDPAITSTTTTTTTTTQTTYADGTVVTVTTVGEGPGMTTTTTTVSPDGKTETTTQHPNGDSTTIITIGDLVFTITVAEDTKTIEVEHPDGAVDTTVITTNPDGTKTIDISYARDDGSGWRAKYLEEPQEDGTPRRTRISYEEVEAPAPDNP